MTRVVCSQLQNSVDTLINMQTRGINNQDQSEYAKTVCRSIEEFKEMIGVQSKNPVKLVFFLGLQTNNRLHKIKTHQEITEIDHITVLHPNITNHSGLKKT